MANISSIGGITRNGRCFTPVTFEMAQSKLLEGLPKQKKAKMVPDAFKEPVIEKKASEFLKFIKHSEYSVVEQLSKLST